MPTMVKAEVDDNVNAIIERVQEVEGMNKSDATAHVLRRGAHQLQYEVLDE